MFSQVLRQRETLAADLTTEGLRVAVDIVVPFQRELCGKFP